MTTQSLVRRTAPRIDIARIVAPQSIAVLGASDDLKKFGGRIIHYVMRNGYPGKVIPVNPRRAEPDGYILLASASSELTVVPTVRRSLSYDPVKDFEPVAVTSETIYLLVANPSIPTSAQAGYPELLARGWNGLMAPKGTPAAVLDEINGAVNEIMQSPDVVKDLKARGTEPGGGTRQAAKQRIENELNRWRDVVQKVGIAPVD